MSYLEYRVKTVPTGWRKILFINWDLIKLMPKMTKSSKVQA